MMTMLKRRNIFALLFAVLLALPMMAILGRVIYVQSNKNAKDSYYGETINQQESLNVTLEELETNVVYTWSKLNFTADTSGFENAYYYLNYAIFNDVIDYQYTYFRVYRNNQNIAELIFYYNDNTFVEYYSNTNVKVQFNLSRINITNTLKYANYDIGDYILYNNYSFLDNAFEYSVNQFIENNNFGKLNFLQWFESMFFENNQKANLYIRFANWYMNYALLLSLVYVLFLVLMWFINFVRKLLEKGMNFGEGSY